MRVGLALLLVILSTPVAGQGVFGRWDLTVKDPGGDYPMWVEVVPGPPAGARLQGRFGHAVPVAGLEVQGDGFHFTLGGENPPRFEARASGDGLAASLVYPDGRRIAVEGRRAPELSRPAPASWGEPIDLLADGLDGWRARGDRNGWSVENGVLINTPPSSDLITEHTFDDFHLHIEFNVPEGGNSGVYLRGRHEVQVQDDYGNTPHTRGLAGVYGQVAPVALPAKPAGEWQTLDITLIGRYVTIALNGVTIVYNAEIPGITGGALDSYEERPGPIMLQGDHSGVQYRNIVVRPARR